MVGGRVSLETGVLIDEAEEKFGVTEGALVRMAMDDYMPRYLSNQGRPQYGELFTQLAQAIDEKPELLTELQKLARKSTRRQRAAASA